MKKVLITSLLFAAVAAHANLVVVPNAVDNWVSANGQPVKNSTGLCWRDANWTPATAHPDCDGALKAVAAATPAQKVDITKPAAVIAARAPIVIDKTTTTYSADTLFDFDKAVIKPEGKVLLDELTSKIRSLNLQLVIAVGHTDSIGSTGYNMKLGLRRAQAVKAYLVAHGVEASKVSVESRGEAAPVADNKTREGRAKNRRVEIEVTGTPK